MKNPFSQRIVAITLALCIVSSGATQVEGEVIYTLSLSAPSMIDVNTPFSAEVLITEMVTGSSVPVLGDPSLGLFQGNFRVARTGPGDIGITGVSGSPSFDSPGPNSFNFDSAQLVQQDLDPSSTPTGNLFAPGVFVLSLGSINLVAGSVGANTFTLEDYDLTQDDLVLGDGTVLDSIVIFNSTTITAVPEPSAIALVAIAGTSALLRKMRRRSSRR